MSRRTRLMITIAVLAAGIPVLAQRPTDVVKWSAADIVHGIKPGEAVGVQLTAVVEPGWHLYALTQPKGGPNPLKIVVAKGHPFAIKTADITAPSPEVINDANFDLDTRQYDGKVIFTVPVAAGSSAKVGQHQVPIEITFQACGNGICLRPFTQTIPIKLAVHP